MIEAVVTCVNYADYLACTLPHLASWVDRVVVVTSLSDWETVKVIDSVPKTIKVQTDAFFTDGTPFAKGRAINQGMVFLDLRGWLLITDADMLFTKPIDVNTLDTTCLHTVERRAVIGRQAYEQVLKGEDVSSHTIPMVYHNKTVIPSGYCQLWHYPTKPQAYPEASATAAKDDMLLSRSWHRSKRRIIPTYRAFHLEMPANKKAANWWGRKTTRFE